MNKNLATVLLTIATLSLFTIALIEISGISSRALFHKYRGYETTGPSSSEASEASKELRQRFAEDSAKLAANRKLPKTALSFKETAIDFGKIKEGDSVRHTFTFVNTGNNPLMIANVNVSCGCTVPSYSKEPVMPGKEGSVSIVFHSGGKQGIQHKQVFVIANTNPENTTLKFSADIIPAK